jgi:hypothetical protein
MRPETKTSRCFPHTHIKMLAAICIASALARRSAPERPAWSLRDDLPAPFLILPGSPARSKGLVCDCGRSHVAAQRFKKALKTCLFDVVLVEESSLCSFSVHARFNRYSCADPTAERVSGHASVSGGRTVDARGSPTGWRERRRCPADVRRHSSGSVETARPRESAAGRRTQRQ